MNYYVGIDVSLEASSLCVVDGNGKIIREGKVASEPEDLVTWLRALKLDLARIGLEAGPLSQWLHAALRQAGFAVELLETGHVRNALKIMPVKTDRNDAQPVVRSPRRPEQHLRRPDATENTQQHVNGQEKRVLILHAVAHHEGCMDHKPGQQRPPCQCRHPGSTGSPQAIKCRGNKQIGEVQ